MPTPKARVKRSASRGRTRNWKKWILILLVALLLIPAMQVAVVRFINPPLTLPMLIEQGSAMFSRAPKRPLLYRWIDLPQIPEMFLEHLWISEDQRFFQHEGFDWKEMELAVKKRSGNGNRFAERPRSRTNAPGRSSFGRADPGDSRQLVSFVRLREAWLTAGKLFVEVIVGTDETQPPGPLRLHLSIRLTFFLRTLWTNV